jgi:lipoate-protein ligase A
VTPWRLLDTGPRDGAWNMACDVALMDRARRTGESVFRIYAWSRPTLSFGRHEAARKRYTAAAIATAGVDVVRRPTGGRALLHDREVTYSVTAPLDPAESLPSSMSRINQWLLRTLHRLGAPATEAEEPRSMRPEGAACFALPARGELTLGGRKLVGSAQVRHDGALLQHGSILLDDDQARIATFAVGPFLPPTPAASLREALGPGVYYEMVRDVLMDVIAAEVSPGSAQSLVFPEDDATLSGDLFEASLAQFRDAAWTWRR